MRSLGKYNIEGGLSKQWIPHLSALRRWGYLPNDSQVTISRAAESSKMLRAPIQYAAEGYFVSQSADD